MHYAVYKNCPIIVKLLCDAKADISIQDNDGNTPIDSANMVDPMIATYLQSRSGKLAGSIQAEVKEEEIIQEKPSEELNIKEKLTKITLASIKPKIPFSSVNENTSIRNKLTRSRSLSPRTREEFRKSRSIHTVNIRARDDNTTSFISKLNDILLEKPVSLSKPMKFQVKKDGNESIESTLLDLNGTLHPNVLKTPHRLARSRKLEPINIFNTVSVIDSIPEEPQNIINMDITSKKDASRRLTVKLTHQLTQQYLLPAVYSSVSLNIKNR